MAKKDEYVQALMGQGLRNDGTRRSIAGPADPAYYQ